MSEKLTYWDEAIAHLIQHDRILCKIIPPIQESFLCVQTESFATLARSVIGQQASPKKALEVWHKVEQACQRRVTAAKILECGKENLRNLGLPQRKTDYLLELAAGFQEKRVHPRKWATMDDEEVIAELTAIRGIGRWTAEMFLIFNLGRPNVLPLDDVRLLKAISTHYFSGEPVSRFEAREVAQAWRPWASVATWYLWRSLDPV